MAPNGGLKKFGKMLNPAVVEDIMTWRDHAELSKLLNVLEGHLGRKAFFDTYAEAIIARHLLRHNCQVRFEVPTPQGKRADFQVTLDRQEFFLHVKRVKTGRSVRKKLTVSSRLRYLERIKRPYVVSIRWQEQLSDKQMRRLVTNAADFILRASVGDEFSVLSDEGSEIGAVRIISPWEGQHVTLAIGLPSGFIDEGPRIAKLMRRAYQQFMPQATNIIMICTSHADDVDDFETALLGDHVERWDQHPPRGRRIAHGRAGDGFWRGQRYADSQIACWFQLGPKSDELACRYWLREGYDPPEPLLRGLDRLFASQPTID